MFKVINKKEEMILDPKLEMDHEQILNSETDIIELYGKSFKMYHDEWKHHLHIKCTDVCDANCLFCIERSARNNRQNPKAVLGSTREVLDQLMAQGMLRTVSITGGEPTLFPFLTELIDMIQSYPVTLFSINTNGRLLERIPENFKGCIDLSKHGIDDSGVYQRAFNVTPEMIGEFRKTHPEAGIRAQYVVRGPAIGHIDGAGNPFEPTFRIEAFMKVFKDVVDDFSFRDLIIDDAHADSPSNHTLFQTFRKKLINEGEFVEQVIQDYYVYETYKCDGKPVTISWSNMHELKAYNESHEDEGFLEEIIVHPDGTVAGSWNKKSLILKDGASDGFFIPCRGVGCKKHCLRYQGEVMYEIPMISGCGSGVDSCGYGSPVTRC